MNFIGTQLFFDPISSGLTRWRMVVYINKWTPPRKSGGILRVSTNQSDSGRVWRMSRLTRDRTAEPVSRDQILRRERGLGNTNFLCVQLTTSRIGNLTRLIQTLLHDVIWPYILLPNRVVCLARRQGLWHIVITALACQGELWEGTINAVTATGGALGRNCLELYRYYFIFIATAV